MGRRNAIVEADLDEDEDLELDASDEEGEEEEFEIDEQEDLTDEDMVEHVQALDDDRRRVVEKSRKQGRAPARGTRTGRKTVAAKDARARTPKREREIEWQPANTLDAPPPRAGMEQRWIRYLLSDKNDPRNWARKTRERWSPRKLDTVSADFAPPTISHGQIGEVIAVGDLILCERPVEIGLSRKKYFRTKGARQMAAAERRHVNKVERDDHPIKGGARRDRPTVGVGRRRQAHVQDDVQ